MKKSLLAMAVGATVMAPGAAFAEAKVYGKFVLGLDHQRDEIGLDFNSAATPGSAGWWKLRDANNASRLGFKGSEDVGLGDLKVIYQLEYGIDPAGIEGTPFSERNIFVGLAGGFGTLRFGRYDTPVKDIGVAVEQFHDNVGDLTTIMVGETRNSDLLSYASPKFGDAVQLVAAVQPGQNRAATDDAAAKDHGLADTYYAALTFTSAMFDAAVGYAGNEVTALKFDGIAASGTATTGVDILRGTAMFRIAGLELGGLYQVADGIDRAGDATALNGGQAQERSWLAGAGYTLEAFKFKGEYGRTEGDSTGDRRSLAGVGVDYKLSKALVTQAYFVEQKQEDGAAVPAGDLQTDTYGLGLIYSF